MSKHWECSEKQARTVRELFIMKLPDLSTTEEQDMRSAITAAIGPEIDRLRKRSEQAERDLFLAEKVVCRLYNVVLGVRAHFSSVRFERSLSAYINALRKKMERLQVPEYKANFDYFPTKDSHDDD